MVGPFPVCESMCVFIAQGERQDKKQHICDRMQTHIVYIYKKGNWRLASTVISTTKGYFTLKGLLTQNKNSLIICSPSSNLADFFVHWDIKDI